MLMSATIVITCVVNNPENIPPRPGTQFGFTLSQFLGRGQLGIPELANPRLSPLAPFAGSSASTQIQVSDTSIQYFISDFDIGIPGGSGEFLGDWNDTLDVILPELFIGPFNVTDGPPTVFTLSCRLGPHEIIH
jgi:hypothetical protein